MDDLWINDDSTSSDGEIDIVDGDDVHNEEQSENGQSTEADTDLSLDDDDDSESESDSTNEPAATTNDKDLPDFLLKCYNILARIRSTVKFVRNNSLVQNYVRAQRSIAPNSISPSEKEVVLDLRIRWNSSYRMLDRFLSHKDIIKTIVSSPEKIDGISKEQTTKLKTFVFTHDEWDLVYHLHQILEPFVIATTVLSGRRYPTIGLSMLVCRNLASFLQQNSDDDGISSRLKKSLSFHFNYYLNGKVEETQKQYMQVSNEYSLLAIAPTDHFVCRETLRLIFPSFFLTNLDEFDPPTKHFRWSKRRTSDDVIRSREASKWTFVPHAHESIAVKCCTALSLHSGEIRQVFSHRETFMIDERFLSLRCFRSQVTRCTARCWSSMITNEENLRSTLRH